MKLQLLNHSSTPMRRKFMTAWLMQLSRELKKRRVSGFNSRAELVVVWINSEHMQELNRTYRGRDYATDILSFEGHDRRTLGELVLCPEVLLKQAHEQKLSFQQEVGYMLIHGVLHLLGYDHEINKRDARKMFALQDDLFETLCRCFETGTKRQIR